MKRNVILGMLLAFGLFSVTAEAGPTYSFVHIVEAGDGVVQLADGAIGVAQMSVELDDTSFGITQVGFIFSNAGPAASSITDVYFDDGTLLGIALIDNSDPGVDFAQFASPPNLPGGNNLLPPFATTAGFSADSNPPAQPLGVNPGEALIVVFDLQGGGVFQDIIDELASGELRIGIHVQGYASGGSESFVNDGVVDPPEVVPAPGAILLGSIGVGFVSWLRRRRTL